MTNVYLHPAMRAEQIVAWCERHGKFIEVDWRNVGGKMVSRALVHDSVRVEVASTGAAFWDDGARAADAIGARRGLDLFPGPGAMA